MNRLMISKTHGSTLAFVAACVLATTPLAGCGDDAGGGGGTLPDSGVPAVEAGTSEAGSPDMGTTDTGVQVDGEVAPLAFDDMDFEQKKTFMKETVLPKMKELFREFDPVEYADLKCSACHGNDMQSKKFEMPNKLTALDPMNMPSVNSMDADEAAYAKFMQDKIVPTMREFLGRKPFDPATGEGFGCFSCHTMK